VTYGFDGGGHITSLTVDGTSILASGAYFPFGAVESWVWGNGQNWKRTFDLDGRVNTLTLGPDTATYPDLGVDLPPGISTDSIRNLRVDLT